MKTIYHNAQVYTGQLPLQQAFLVENDTFLAVGTNQEILALNAEKIVDLKGAFVCPGFNDSHMHLLNFGQILSIAPLSGHTSSLADMLQCLSQTAPGRGGWILGRGWNQDYFTDVPRMPNRWDLDKVSLDRPVCATRACGHVLAVNSKALEIRNITALPEQIEGGEIGLTDGVPNGLFYDNAMDLVLSSIPAPSKEDVKI